MHGLRQKCYTFMLRELYDSFIIFKAELARHHEYFILYAFVNVFHTLLLFVIIMTAQVGGLWGNKNKIFTYKKIL